jgi:hypothetical protein
MVVLVIMAAAAVAVVMVVVRGLPRYSLEPVKLRVVMLMMPMERALMMPTVLPMLTILPHTGVLTMIWIWSCWWS